MPSSPVVSMWIEKFAKVVLIEHDHPLAVAQRVTNAERFAAPSIAPALSPSGTPDAASVSLEIPDPSAALVSIPRGASVEKVKPVPEVVTVPRKRRSKAS